MTIGTGQSKTAMIWMIAIALQNETGASRILIVTPNDAIMQQFQATFLSVSFQMEYKLLMSKTSSSFMSSMLHSLTKGT